MTRATGQRVLPILFLWLSFPNSFALECNPHPGIQEKVDQLLLHKRVAPLVGYINSNDGSGFKILPIERSPPCGHDSISDSSPYDYLPTALQLYRYDPSLNPSEVLLVSACRVVTSCRQYWMIPNRQEVVDVIPVSFNHLPQPETEIFLRNLPQKIHNYETGREYYEFLKQEVFDCPIFSKIGKKETFALRLKRLPSTWSSKGTLVAPFVSPSCSLFNETKICSLTDSQMIFWDNLHLGISALVATNMLTGLLEIAKSPRECPPLSRFLSTKTRLQISFGSTSALDLHPRTWVRSTLIYLSPEGFLFSFHPHDGLPVFASRCPSWKPEPPPVSSSTFGRRVRSPIFTHISNWKLPVLEVNSTLNRSRMPRAIRSHAITDFPLEFQLDQLRNYPVSWPSYQTSLQQKF